MKNENQEERLTFPCRGLIIFLLLAALAIFWLWLLISLLGGKTDFGGLPKNLQQVKPQDRVLPYNPARSEIIRKADGSWLIKWTGEGEEGFRLPDLAPGGYSLTWLRGKIVYSANGHFFPLWGADNYRKENLRYFHLRNEGIRPHQVILIKGTIGSGEEELIPFRPGKTRICFRADGRPIVLFYHFTQGDYEQFGWDGSYAVFQLKRIE